MPRLNTYTTGGRGSEGYKPDPFRAESARWSDGDFMWDRYAFVCTVVECDLPKGGWAKVRTGTDIKDAMSDHVKKKTTCPHLFKMA